MNMPALETGRLYIRPFTMADFEGVHRILDPEEEGPLLPEGARAARRAWLQWTVLGYTQRAALSQPPYGERAVTLKGTGRLVGAAGLVPSFNAFALLPPSRSETAPPAQVYSAEVGLFYQIAKTDRRQGYAAEAARALIDYSFKILNLGRIIATTEYDNAASMAVMRKLGMRIERNPSPDPPWLQVVGVLANPAFTQHEVGSHDHPERPSTAVGLAPGYRSRMKGVTQSQDEAWSGSAGFVRRACVDRVSPGAQKASKMNTINPLDLSEFPVLETKRLVLREIVPADARDLLLFTGDPIVQRYNARPMTDISEALASIEQERAVYVRQDGVLWGITLKNEDRVMGRVGFSAWSTSNRAMLGYDLARKYWGRGIASEAVRAIIGFGFARMGLNRIAAETIEDNHESRRMLERIGFVCEGIRREYSLEDDGLYHGSAMYGLLRNEYEKGE